MNNDTIKTHIIKIGNSQGVRLPKTLLELSGIEGEVEIQLIDGTINIKPIRKPRQDWDKHYQDMSAKGDDQLLDPYTSTEWDNKEWEWK